MRRPQVELSDAAASYVEQHPEQIELLAGQASTEQARALSPAQKDRLRTRLRETREFARSPEGETEAAAFLARYSVR